MVVAVPGEEILVAVAQWTLGCREALPRVADQITAQALFTDVAARAAAAHTNFVRIEVGKARADIGDVAIHKPLVCPEEVE